MLKMEYHEGCFLNSESIEHNSVQESSGGRMDIEVERAIRDPRVWRRASRLIY